MAILVALLRDHDFCYRGKSAARRILNCHSARDSVRRTPYAFCSLFFLFFSDERNGHPNILGYKTRQPWLPGEKYMTIDSAVHSALPFILEKTKGSDMISYRIEPPSTWRAGALACAFQCLASVSCFSSLHPPCLLKRPCDTQMVAVMTQGVIGGRTVGSCFSSETSRFYFLPCFMAGKSCHVAAL